MMRMQPNISNRKQNKLLKRMFLGKGECGWERRMLVGIGKIVADKGKKAVGHSVRTRLRV